ncbi:VOC family protein [Bacillus pinisoli]|uniref:VOC family protein n=1 Tax=Bacillus pinisoli TaxID=2901866 RepID=UPI002342FFE5|nr:VOC family protein [Bacillus pinisoli]
MHHIGIYVKNLMKSEKFYQEMLGFKVETKLKLGKEDILFMKKGDARIELISDEDVKSVEGTIHLALEVPNVELSMRPFAEKGIQPIEGPTTLENGWKTVFYLGPDLEVIELLQT